LATNIFPTDVKKTLNAVDILRTWSRRPRTKPSMALVAVGPVLCSDEK
jgi:hypothetical protein